MILTQVPLLTGGPLSGYIAARAGFIDENIEVRSIYIYL
jgi:hypothetical protein